MEFIDTHQHLFWRKRLGYAWTAGIPVLASGDFLPEDYLAGVAGLGVVGSLFMEAGVDDAGYQAEARHVATEVGRNGILGQIASCRPETAEGFDAWLDECADLRVHGLRRILHVVPDEVSQGEVFRANLRKIGQRGWTFDMCFLARQLPIAADLARACPDQVLVLDHCGVPDIAGGAFAVWAEGITALAKLPNVMVKLSGIAAYCAPGTVTLQTLRPWVDHVVQSFGPERMVWGSDWPVVLIGTELPSWLVLTRDLLAGLSEDEKAMIGHRNARRIYRLEG
jgi:predicted TIM-barrel fold metal-dependent hydrolase